MNCKKKCRSAAVGESPCENKKKKKRESDPAPALAQQPTVITAARHNHRHIIMCEINKITTVREKEKTIIPD